MAAVLSCEMQHTDAIVTMREECLRMGLTMLPPDVNHSQFRFTVPSPHAIRYGLGAIKGAGEAALEGIIAERDTHGQIGNAPCRERACQSVSLTVVAVSLKK